MFASALILLASLKLHKDVNKIGHSCKEVQAKNNYIRIITYLIYNHLLQNLFKACVRYFSLFLKDKCISSLARTKYIEKKFNLELFFLLTASRTFILSCVTTRYPPLWNFSFRKNNCMFNRDNARDVAACPDE